MEVPAVNAVYYPSWRVYKDLPPSKLQVGCVTHIFYAFVRVNTDGTLRLLDEWADTQIDVDGEKGCLNALAKLKRQHPRLKTIVSVGGGGGSEEFPAVATQAKTRETFARALREFVDRYSLDGVDSMDVPFLGPPVLLPHCSILGLCSDSLKLSVPLLTTSDTVDWEHPNNGEEGTNYLHLLQTLRAHLPAPRYLLTTALPVAAYCLKHINLFAASHVLDYINLMCYDYTGPWTEVSGHQAQLLPPPNPHDVFPVLRRSCHHGIDYLIHHGFPRTKILMGIPAYVRYFPGARAPGHPFRKDECGEMDYCELPPEWIASARVDEDLGAACYVDEGGKGFVSLDVPATVRQKAGYAKAMGIAGLFYWTGAGDVVGPNSLVAAGWRGLHEL